MQFLCTIQVIKVYRLSADMSIVKHTEISLLTTPDHIFIDRQSGDIFVATHPVIYRLLAHMRDPTVIDSPSQILKIRMQPPDHRSWTITESYADDGHRQSASSTCVYFGEQLLIGSVYRRPMLCDVINSQYL